MQSMRFWSICGLLPNSYRQGRGSCHATLLIWDNHPSFKKALLKCPNVVDVPNSHGPQERTKASLLREVALLCDYLAYRARSVARGEKEPFMDRH